MRLQPLRFGRAVCGFRNLTGQRVLLGLEALGGRTSGSQLDVDGQHFVDEIGARRAPGGGAAHALWVAAQQREVEHFLIISVDVRRTARRKGRVV